MLPLLILGALVVLFIGGLILLSMVVSCVNVIPEYERALIFRLGKVKNGTTVKPGVVFTWPVIDKLHRVDVRIRTVDIPPQDTLTRDNITVKVDAVAYYRIFNVVDAVTKVENYDRAVRFAAMSTLREVVGRYSLDELLSERETINDYLKQIVDEMSDPWGVDVVNVEISDVELPLEMQRAMAKQAEASRERKARVIKALGEKEAIQNLNSAAEVINENPTIMELRKMQMITEVGVEQETTTIVFMPYELYELPKNVVDMADVSLSELLEGMAD